MQSDFLQEGFEDEGFDRVRLDAEWRALNAFRELLRLSSGGSENATYENSFALARELLPKLFDPETSLISKGLEPAPVREYRQMAEKTSILEKKTVTPLELIERDMKNCRQLLGVGGSTHEIKRRLNRLEEYRNYFVQKGYSEHQLIRRDVFQAVRPELPNPTTHDNFKEYELPNERMLRIRMLHPDRPEHSTGADLVYEVCSPNDRKARFVFVQYKIWDGQKLYFSKVRNLDDQLARLHGMLCTAGFCDPSQDAPKIKEYRLPNCAGFVRLTDKLQSPDARLVSSGLHVPVCVIMQWADSTSGVPRIISRGDVISRSASSGPFEEHFQNEMLGSRWLKFADIESLYKEHKILDQGERITIYAQEYQ